MIESASVWHLPHTAAALLVALLAAAPAVGQEYQDPSLPAGSPVARVQSFEETEVPAFVSADKGKVSLSDRRAQEGRQSLRWDWVPGDRLTFRTGTLGKIDARTGYGGYSRSAFSMRARPEAADAGVMTFRWMAGGKVAAHFDLPLVFDGWQHVCYHYPPAQPDSRLTVDDPKALRAADRIVVEPPAAGKGGTLYFDAVSFNRPVDYRGGRDPIRERWKPKAIAESGDAALLAPPTPKELEAVTHLLATLRAPGKEALTEAQVAERHEELRKKYDLRRHPDGLVTGKAVPRFSTEITGDMLSLANTWLGAREGTDPKVLARLEETYFLLDDFFREAGAVAQGAMDGMNWYGGRNHAAACFLMAEPLRRTGRLERVRDCLKYFWGYDNLMYSLPEGRRPMGMDYFRNDVPPLLRVALMHDDPKEVVSHLRACSRRFDVDIRNSIEVDGSLYHHGFHYYAYANGAVVQMAEMIRVLGPTPFAISRASYEKLRMAVMNMRYYGNRVHIPVPMHGRHPGRQGLETRAFSLLAQASPHYNNGKMDPDLAAATLRLRPDDRENPLFAGFAPEPDPQGNLAMNYAGLIGHRRDGWLTQVRGYGKHYNAFESYAACNRHGLFMGNGYLTLLGTGDPVNLVDSGCDVGKGWDWRHLDGCTTYEAPLEVIANGHGTLGDISDVGFIGGLSHRGTNGLFVMPLHSKRQYAKGLPKGAKDDGTRFFTANKTYFLFDRRIVCLGSDISLPDLPYPVQTTLFQNTLAPIGSLREASVETGSPGTWTRKTITHTVGGTDVGKPLYVNLESSRAVSTCMIGWDKAAFTGPGGAVANGDFEEGAPGRPPAGWMHTRIGDKAEHPSVGVRLSGGREAGKQVVTKDGGKWLNGGGSSVFSQRVVEAMVPGATYEFSVLVQSAGSSYAVSRIYFSTSVPGKAGEEEFPPVSVDGKVMKPIPYEAKLEEGRPHTLADIQGNGYYLPAGQAVTVYRRNQKSASGCDDKPTEGNAATALIEHGVNPADGRYAYFLLPKTTPEALAAFAAAMEKPEAERPALVRQQDSRAHIVYDRAARSWGCVFFAAQAVAPETATAPGAPPLPVAEVSGPCLVIAEHAADGALFVSICDPDLHREGNDSKPSQVTVTLQGRWSPKEKVDNITVTALTDGRTQLTVTCQDGKTYLASLQGRE